jgi:hypothetical protein
MNINELFDEIQDRFLPEDLNGEFTLHGNCIVWTYDLDKDDVEDEIIVPTNNKDDDEDAPLFDFESSSTEELLQEAYDEDIILIEQLLDELEESDNWLFSEPEINENIISFKIF